MPYFLTENAPNSISSQTPLWKLTALPILDLGKTEGKGKTGYGEEEGMKQGKAEGKGNGKGRVGGKAKRREGWVR